MRVNLSNESFVIGTVYNSPKMEIPGNLEDCLEFVEQKFPKSGIKIQGDFKINHGHSLKSLTTDAKDVA